jgi:sterol desaturase/sphingolipid hydroxylase (fatty acid hydroxylase superfamily)
MMTGLSFAAGIVTWWLLEYVLHRFVGHMPRGRSLFSREHRRHHAEGDYFAPSRTKAVSVAPVMAAVAAGLSFAVGPGPGLAFTAGLALQYLAYEVFHRRLHTHAPRTAYGRWARRHHFHHHFVNPKANHGVTTPLGDLAWGTLDPEQRIPVPERLAMAWLLDPETGDVAAPYQREYVLVRLGESRKAA